MKKEIKTTGVATPEQIAEWKADYNDIYEILVIGEEQKHVGYVRKPDLKAMADSAEGGEGNNITTAILMLNMIWIGGDDRILKDEELKAAALKQVSTIFKIRESEIKKL